MAYHEGLNASIELFRVAAIYDIFDLDPDELASRSEHIAEQSQASQTPAGAR
jgi:hypothetical protein